MALWSGPPHKRCTGLISGNLFTLQKSNMGMENPTFLVLFLFPLKQKFRGDFLFVYRIVFRGKHVAHLKFRAKSCLGRVSSQGFHTKNVLQSAGSFSDNFLRRESTAYGRAKMKNACYHHMEMGHLWSPN